MNRTSIDNGTWFDQSKAIRFDQDSYWNGSNYIGVATGSQWVDQELYYTKKGNWVVRTNYRIEPCSTNYEQISEEEAVKWLIRNDYHNFDHFVELPQKTVDRIQEGMELLEV